MRSEHFKAELITNVSHDLKTPLTSIINYVDLLKKVDIQDPKAAEYIEVPGRPTGTGTPPRPRSPAATARRPIGSLPV